MFRRIDEVHMITVNVRKQGGAAVMTIPSDVMRLLNIEVGSTLELDIVNGAFTVRPVGKRKRYSLNDLLHGATPKVIAELNEATKWAREGQAVGREIA